MHQVWGILVGCSAYVMRGITCEFLAIVNGQRFLEWLAAVLLGDDGGAHPQLLDHCQEGTVRVEPVGHGCPRSQHGFVLRRQRHHCAILHACVPRRFAEERQG